MPDTVHPIPLTEIDAEALSRDRSSLDEAALAELTQSIALNGLRLPIELFHLAEETPEGHKYGLLSSYRRLKVFQAQHALTGAARYATIPAFLREPPSLAAIFAAMVEENEIRADLSPWERGRVAVTARDQGVFTSIEQAVDTLYAAAPRQKRARLRAIALLAEDLDGTLTAPETLNMNQALRLATAVTKGFGELIRTAITGSSLKDPASQWQILLPILAESELPESANPRDPRPGRPRRVVRPRAGLTIRRERTRDGYVLYFTGREASGMLIDTVLDEIERMYSSG